MDLFGPMTAKAIHVNACSMYFTAKLTIAHGRMLEQCLGAQRTPPGMRAKLSGLMPNRSWASTSRRRASHNAITNMPLSSCRKSSPALVEMDEYFGVRMVGG